MSSAAWAKEFMGNWLAAANRRDVDTIMTLYARDAELESPIVVEVLNVPSGRIRGADNLRGYFTKAFASVPYFKYHLMDAAWGLSSLTCWYINHKGTRSIAYLEFDVTGKIRRHVNHFAED